MQAMYLDHEAGPEALVGGELEQPRPAAGEVLVQVYATSPTPTEFGWSPTFAHGFPVVPCHEFSGVVAGLGPGVAGLTPGQEVYGLNDWYSNGALAEYCLAPAAGLAPKPASISHEQAAVVPISALTAWQALVGRVSPGDRVLIHGGSGGVGVFAVQLAGLRGAHVLATASGANLDFVRSLGADEVIDYRTERFEEVAGELDFILDTVGGDTLKRSRPLLRPGGKLVTLVEKDAEEFMLVKPDREQLEEIAILLDAGELQVFVEVTYPLERAREAYERALQGGMRGKAAITCRR